jgi:hypothetical protein
MKALPKMNTPANTETALASSRYLNRATLVVIKGSKPANPDRHRNKDMKTEIDRLNKLACKAPFCIIHKVRKFDLL